MNNSEELIYKFFMLICKKRKLVSTISAIAISWFYYNGKLHSIKDLLPDIITFSTVQLAVVSINFSLFPSIIKSPKYRNMKQNFKKAIKELNSLVRSSVILSIIVVMFSLLLITINIEFPLFVRLIISFVGSYLFLQMTITSLGSFLIIFYLYNTVEVE